MTPSGIAGKAPLTPSRTLSAHAARRSRSRVAMRSRYAVLCHPHPLHGGTMENKVVTTLGKALRIGGVAPNIHCATAVGNSETRESTMAISSERPRPVCDRSNKAARIDHDAKMPAARSPIESPSLVGGPAGSPVIAVVFCETADILRRL